jgi:hypothetical protein
MKADYSKFNLKESAWVPGKAPNSPREERLIREHAKAVRNQLAERIEEERLANKAALSTPLLIALWAFFEKQNEGWSYAKQDGTEVSFDGGFDLKDLAAAIEESLK